jgi:N-formylglutamate amidohydrolase
MRITNKVLTLNIEYNVQVGHNGAIEATLGYTAFIFRNEKTQKMECDLDFSDVTNVKFMGMSIEEGYKGYGKFKTHMLEMGIDVCKIFDEKAKQLITDKEIEKLKEMYTFIN